MRCRSHHGVEPRPHLACGDCQQEILGGPTARHPHDPRRRDGDATTYANAIAETENAQSLDKIKASGKSTVYYLTPSETAEWNKAMYAMHAEMADRVGKDTIQAVYKAAGYVVPK